VICGIHGIRPRHEIRTILTSEEDVTFSYTIPDETLMATSRCKKEMKITYGVGAGLAPAQNPGRIPNTAGATARVAPTTNRISRRTRIEALTRLPTGKDYENHSSSAHRLRPRKRVCVRGRPQEHRFEIYLQIKRSCRRVAATLPTGRRAGKYMKMNHSPIGRALSPAAGLRVPPIRIISVYLRLQFTSESYAQCVRHNGQSDLHFGTR
jgi:hypothetical protein